MSNSTDFCNIEFRNEKLGKLYLIHGTFYFPLYIVCIIVLSRKPLIEQSCYKIMSAMGIMDLILLSIATYVCGFWSLRGASLCDNWLAMKIAGSIIDGGWVSYCWLCTLLGLNRVIESSGNQQRVLWYFGGHRPWFWIAGCFILGTVYMGIFLSPYSTLVYHSGIGLFLFDPQTDQKIGLYLNTINNVVVSVSMILLYSLVCFYVVSFANTSGDLESSQTTINSTERRIILQAFLICFLATCLAIGYVTIPLVTQNLAVFAAMNVFWQFVQGSNAIIYFIFNQTIRHKVLVLCGIKKENQQTIQVGLALVANLSAAKVGPPQLRFHLSQATPRKGWTDEAGTSNRINPESSRNASNRVSGEPVIVHTL